MTSSALAVNLVSFTLVIWTCDSCWWIWVIRWLGIMVQLQTVIVYSSSGAQLSTRGQSGDQHPRKTPKIWEWNCMRYRLFFYCVTFKWHTLPFMDKKHTTELGKMYGAVYFCCLFCVR